MENGKRGEMQMKLLFVLCEKKQARQGRTDERCLKPLF